MKKFYHKIDSIAGQVITMRASHVAYGEQAYLHRKNGHKTMAEVNGINDAQVSLKVFGTSHGIRTDDQVEFLGHSVKLNFKKHHLLGRIFNGSGEPIDGRPLLDSADRSMVTDLPFNPVKCRLSSTMIPTGIPLIDLFNPLGEGQSATIFRRSGESYHELFMHIAHKAKADIIILGTMGVKQDELLYFKDRLARKRAQSIMFVHTALDSMAECMAIPDLALAAAGQYAVLGHRVLVILADMQALCDSVKEEAVAMNRMPCSGGYPTNLYATLARHYERAAHLEGAGSVTLLTVATLPDDDMTHPIAVNIGALTHNQLHLKGGLIDPLSSRSCFKNYVREDHAPLMNTMIRLYNDAQKAKMQQAMGFSLSSYDEKLLSFAREFKEKMMDLSVRLPLVDQLYLGWQVLAHHFLKEEICIPKKLIEKYWYNL